MDFYHECRDCGWMIEYHAETENETVVLHCSWCGKRARLNGKVQPGKNAPQLETNEVGC